jgi:hypothetical protein
VAPEPASLVSVELREILRSAGPRFVRDGLGPLAVFFAGWKLIGLVPGIALAAVFGVVVFVHERRQGRPGTVVRLALLLVAIRAIVGVASHSATTYLAQEVGIDTLLGVAVLLSLRGRLSFAAWFAADFYEFPAIVVDSETYRGAMRTVTIAWGTYFLLRASVRLAALLTLSTNAYVLVIALTDAPFLLGLLTWSVWYTGRAIRSTPEWAAQPAALG